MTFVRAGVNQLRKISTIHAVTQCWIIPGLSVYCFL